MECNKMECLKHKIDCIKHEVACEIQCHKNKADSHKHKSVHHKNKCVNSNCKTTFDDVKQKIDSFNLEDIKIDKTLLGLLLALAGTAIGIAWLSNLRKETVIVEEATSKAIEPSKLLSALKAADDAIHINSDATGPFEVAPLEYDYTTLEPAMSESTLRLHHESVYKDYVDSLNTALNKHPECYQYTLHELLLYPDKVTTDIRADILRHAGGTYNHGLLWKTLGEAYQSEPVGAFLEAINKQFGSFENLKDVLSAATESVETAGYSWLALNPYGRLIVLTTKDEFTPIPLRMIPLLPIDLWEHALYADYKGQKLDYLEELFTIIDWERVGDRYNAAIDIFNS